MRAVEDPELLATLSRQRVALDVCPTSNLRLGVVPALEQHPIRALVAAGVPVTVSSDDPLPFQTNLSKELGLLHDRLGFTLPALRELTLHAARHSFLPEAERAALAAVVRAGWPAGEV